MADQPFLTEAAARFTVELTYDAIPEAVRERARHGFVDGVGLMLSGVNTPCGRVLRRYMRNLTLMGMATSVGTGLRMPAEYAALHNGVSSHVHDYDDTQIGSRPDRVYGLLTHPTSPVLGAALPTAEEVSADGKALLVAYVAGVEVACKAAEAIRPQHYRNGFHSTGTLGVLGAAAAAAKLLHCDVEQTRHAIGIAASTSSGIRAAFGTMTKPFHAGHAAMNGVVAAKMASAGYRTDPNALDGQWGFFQVAGGGSDPELMIGKLGNPYTFVDPGISIKPYPSGSLLHPAMDAVLDLVREHDIKQEQVAHVRVGTNSAVLQALRYPRPADGLQGKFSIPFALALLFVDRRVGIGSFSDEAVRRPDIQGMMERIEAHVDPEIEKMGFDRIRARIQVQLASGEVLTREAEVSRGMPQRPMSRAEIEAKFRDCAEGVLSAQAVDRALEALWRVDQVANVRDVTRLVLG